MNMPITYQSHRFRTLTLLIDRASRMSRLQKRLMVMMSDGVLCVLSVWFSFFLRLGEWRFFDDNVARLMLGAFVFWYFSASCTGVYREVFRYVGTGAMFTLTRAIGLMLAPMIAVFLINLVPGVPRTLAVIQPLIFFLFLTISRQSLRFFIFEVRHLGGGRADRKRILIYGAGDAGQRLASSIRHQPGLQLLGFVDDDRRKSGHRLDRTSIYHSSELSDLVRRESITDIHIAIPRLSRNVKNRVMESLAEQPVQVMTLPDVRDIISGDVSINELREVEISDLLGRSSVDPDEELLGRTITGRSVMVTGAGGSIGSELAMQIARLHPERMILVELNEYALYTIDNAIVRKKSELGVDFPVVPELCNVSDRASIMRIMERHRPDTVFHTAAYKHVPLVEANVIGGARNNILGTLYTVQASIEAGISHFILISTDKAVRPTNIMGATKRVCEQILQAYAENGGGLGKTVFAMVRFGNVLGSSGSVVPLFKRQILEGGPITVTDFRINRYFMTIPEAAQLVIQAGGMAQGGEVYVLDMGEAVKIIDLAKTMIRLSGLREKDRDTPDGDIEIVEVGLRPGEKLYEELLIGNNPLATSHERIMQARESHISFGELMPALDHLSRLLDAGDSDAVRDLISKLVPEYRALM